MTGGGIVHITIGERITAKQAERLWDHAVAAGCEHFAFNPILSVCHGHDGGEGHVIFGKVDVCPVCGAKVDDWLTRVVGYFTHEPGWGPERREHDFPNRKPAELPED